MRLRFLIFLLACAMVFRVEAGALPAFSGAVNRAVAQTIEKAAIRRGFAANDPRFAMTYTGAATVAATVAADAAAAAVTAASAPVWLSIAGALGAAAVVGGLAYGIYKVLFDDTTSPAKFYVQSSAGGAPYGTVGVASGGSNFTQDGLKIDGMYRIVGSKASRVVQGLPVGVFGYALYCDTPDNCMSLAKKAWESYNDGSEFQNLGCDAETSVGVVVCHTQRVGSGGVAQGGTWIKSDIAMQMGDNALLAGQTIKGKISDIVAAIPDSELAKSADPGVIATLANDLWQRAAAQPDYQGLPYSVTDPVTVVDAQVVEQANPSTWPRNADLVSPVAQTATQPVTISPTYNPMTDPGTNTGTNPSTGAVSNVNVVNVPTVKVDFGPDPTVATPTLESIPTAQMILSPLLSLGPSLRNFVVPGHGSECPKPSVTLFDKSMVMDTHCKVLEQIRPTLYVVMAAVWVMIAAFVILRA